MPRNLKTWLLVYVTNITKMMNLISMNSEMTKDLKL